MLSKERNERITRVGPGTPMGNTMRRYWMPALLSWELPEPDCEPVRLRILGEDLVAFRATDGRVGVLDELCPHRLASLFLGRNEDNGLRCIYHGWKFDVEGRCVEQLNEARNFCSKVRTTAYPTTEVGGVIWVYMGPADKQPAPPNYAWTQVPENQRFASKVVEECNWLQALEGGIDTSHFTILHRAITKDTKQAGVEIDSPGVLGGAPSLEVDIKDYGYAYFGVRPLGADDVYVRGYHFIMPFTQLRPPGPNKQQTHGHYWVPIDDDNCMVWNFYHTHDGQPISKTVDSGAGNELGVDVDIHNGFVSKVNRSNNWNIDRNIQRTDTYSGIKGINAQDRAVQESMGRIVDRSREHLGPADRAIIATRKLLLEAVDVVEQGGDPSGTRPTYYEVLAAEATLLKSKDWRLELLPRMYPETNGSGTAGRADAIQIAKMIYAESEVNM